MSKVQTSAEILQQILPVKFLKQNGAPLIDEEAALKILEEWAKQLQPQQEQSYFNNVVVDESDVTEGFMRAVDSQRTTIESAEERGWNRGAEAMRSLAFQCAQDYALESWRHGYVDSSTPHNALKQGAREVATSIQSLPLPPYQKKGE